MDNQISKVSSQEEEIIKFWRDNNIFARSIEQRSQESAYVFYDGPPFATGLPHYGHILSSVTKDLFPRYQAMKGHRVRRRWGWDCHGLPIETLVEKSLGISGKREIEDKVGIEKFNQTARSMVLGYVHDWKKTIERIGRWVEFDDSYKTMDTSYMESVWWVLGKLWEDNLIYEGRKVLMYCPRCETPVSNAEISMDNSYKDVTEEAATVKFKLKPGQKFGNDCQTGDTAYILAWTTTPWTLPGNVALAVGPQIEYTALRIKGVAELYIVASKLVEKVFKDREVEIVHNDLLGKDLEGLEYEPLYEIEKVKNSGKRAWYVTTADFVTTEDGTGVVHTAVIYGEDDFNLGQKIDLPQVPLLDSSGHFNEDAPEFIAKKYYKQAEKDIKEDLEARNLLFSRDQYTHSYPFCWRCESPLIYNAISAWFIEIQKNKEKIIALNEKINWYPEYLKHGRFLNILGSAPDWNISRNRYWATPLPFWKCEGCQKAVCISSIKDLQEKSTNFKEVYPNFSPDESHKSLNDIESIDLHRPYIDELILECPDCNGKMKRIPEVIDCWVESSSMPFAEWHYPFENKQNFESRYPGQFIGEYISQTRAWFYYMHVIGSLAFDNISFENVVATGVILNEKGEKMSKSKNNFPDPAKMIDLYGADTLRFYMMSSVVMQAENLFFNEREMREIYNKVINITLNILSFYKIYKTENSPTLNFNELGLMDRYILSRLKNCLEYTQIHLDEYNTVKACKQIREFIDELSTWWLRRSRERFRSSDEADSQNAIATLEFVLSNFAKIIAPIIPFTAEIIWQSCIRDGMNESVHLADWPQIPDEFENESLSVKMTQAKKIVELGHSLRSANSLRVRQPIGKMFWNSDFGDDSQELEKIILVELNAKSFDPPEEMTDAKQMAHENLSVSIDCHLDAQLIEEGDTREIVRAIQDKRKKIGLKPGELKKIIFASSENGLKELVERNSEFIIQSASLSGIEFSDDLSGDDLGSVNSTGGELKFQIK
jgi:isoleucyl-tRNA synthetase